VLFAAFISDKYRAQHPVALTTKYKVHSNIPYFNKKMYKYPIALPN